MKGLPSRVVPRFFAPGQLSLGAEIDLPERAARHCAVLRLRRGAAVVLFNGEGGEFSAELTRITRGAARAYLISRQAPERESPLAIALAQCLSSGQARRTLAQRGDRRLRAMRAQPHTRGRGDHRLRWISWPGSHRRATAASGAGCGARLETA